MGYSWLPPAISRFNQPGDRFWPAVGRTCECGIHKYWDWSRNQSPADTIKRLCYLEYVFARVVDDRVPCASREQQPNGEGTDQEHPAPSGYQWALLGGGVEMTDLHSSPWGCCFWCLWDHSTHSRLVELFSCLFWIFPSLVSEKYSHSNSGMKMRRNQSSNISGKSMVLTHQRSKMYPVKWEFMVRNSRRGERGVREWQPVRGGKHFLTAQLVGGRREGRLGWCLCLGVMLTSMSGHCPGGHMRGSCGRVPWVISWENTGHRMGTDLCTLLPRVSLTC